MSKTVELNHGHRYQFDHLCERDALLGFYDEESQEFNVNNNYFSLEHSTNIIKLVPEAQS